MADGTSPTRVRWEGDLARDKHQLSSARGQLSERVNRLFGRSLHIRTVDSGSCSACESEIRMLTSPPYDMHRLGLFFSPAPRHADCLLVTGVATVAMEPALLSAYRAMPEPRLVIATGACALGGTLAPSALVHGEVQAVLPVDVFIPGCPPSPLALIQGLLLAVGRLEQRLERADFELSAGER